MDRQFPGSVSKDAAFRTSDEGGGNVEGCRVSAEEKMTAVSNERAASGQRYEFQMFLLDTQDREHQITFNELESRAAQ